MLKTLVILIALVIAVVNISAQSNGFGKHTSGGHHVVKKIGVVRVGPVTTYLKEGLSTAEVLRLLGEPVGVSESNVSGSLVKTYEFPRGDNRILIAEFVNDSLVHSRTETRATVVDVGR